MPEAKQPTASPRVASRYASRAGRWLERLLALSGLALLVFALGAAMHRSVAADAALEVFDHARLSSAPAPTTPDHQNDSIGNTGAPPAAGELGELAVMQSDQALWSESARSHWEASMSNEVAKPVAALSIPRFDLRLAVLAGVDDASLHRSVGWIPGTAFPGESGNVGIAGHRDSHFRPLKDIRIGDRIILESEHEPVAYEVTGLTVVSPEENYLLAPSDGDRLTLVTCYPFYFIGSAPERWVVTAEPIEPLAEPGGVTAGD